MSQGPLCPNLSQKVQKEVSQMANHNLSCAMLVGGLSVNLNHLKSTLTHTTNMLAHNTNKNKQFWPKYKVINITSVSNISFLLKKL